MSLSHVDTREFGAAVAPGGRHGVDDASDNTHTERDNTVDYCVELE